MLRVVRRALCLVMLVFGACPPSESADAGLPCDSNDDCRAAGACRRGVCTAAVPCGDDLECGLGERCLRVPGADHGQCRFTGCTADSDCATGTCLVESFFCAECGADSDCPTTRPVCHTSTNTCVQCRTDSDCALPGPAHCSSEGACVACTTDSQCPNGLTCGPRNVCVGVPLNGACPLGTSCGPGLACVSLNASPTCLTSCALYAPRTCNMGKICYKLTYANSTALVFESDGPIGACFAPQPGARGLREACVITNGVSTCQPNLQCVPETSTLKLCRAFCDPLRSGGCAAGEKCVSFVGDTAGRAYGLCLADSGFGVACAGDVQCRAGLSCQPWDDPSSAAAVSPVCQFNAGGKAGLSPCATLPLSDGGVLPADRTCQSARCVSDPVFPAPATPPYFCFASCATDHDCPASGVCDGQFDVTTPSGTMGTARGCRPGCRSSAECAGFDAGVVCRVRFDAAAATYAATCAPSSGALLAGAACHANAECRSGFCQLEDGRGVSRQGTCVEPCSLGERYVADAGLALACGPTAVVVGHSPERYATPSLCAGAPCRIDEECGPDGGLARCVPEVDPADAGQALVLRCRGVSAGEAAGGASCTFDGQCQSGVCAQLASGTGGVCFEACAAGSTCPASTTCRAGGVAVRAASGQVFAFDACAP